jgi:peptidoglycan-N-acetylmuramic acid deacetylase
MKVNLVKKYLKYILFLLILTLLTDIPVLAGKAYNWFFKAVSDHSQPVVFGGNKMPDKYGAIYLGSPDDKVIYLTFDAGYENGNVEKILDILKEHSVPAAFFILPELPRNYSQLVRRMANEGHLVCNHSYTHRDLSGITDYNEFSEELTKLEEVCQNSAGVAMAKYFRPPKGVFSEKNLEHLQIAGYVPVFWSFAYPDWDNRAQKDVDWAYNKIMSNVHNGMVILLHPTSATNVAVLGRVITDLKAMGYRFGTLDELNAYCRSKGQR